MAEDKKAAQPQAGGNDKSDSTGGGKGAKDGADVGQVAKATSVTGQKSSPDSGRRGEDTAGSPS